jgi:hypothetical protein
MSRYRIEGWRQPQGPGYGWSKCSEAIAEKFFVFKDDSRLTREFITKGAAKDFVKRCKELDARLCSICGAPFEGHGHNAMPINEGRCCDSCCNTLVVPRRIELLGKAFAVR